MDEEPEETVAFPIADRRRPLTTLSEVERNDVCVWAALEAPGGSETCPDGSLMIERGWTEESCSEHLTQLSDACNAQLRHFADCVRLSDCEAVDRHAACERVEACQITAAD